MAVKAKKMSERGEWLLNSHAKAQGNPAKKCDHCGCKIRGPNHDEGTHHLSRVKKK